MWIYPSIYDYKCTFMAQCIKFRKNWTTVTIITTCRILSTWTKLCKSSLFIIRFVLLNECFTCDLDTKPAFDDYYSITNPGKMAICCLIWYFNCLKSLRFFLWNPAHWIELVMLRISHCLTHLKLSLKLH